MPLSLYCLKSAYFVWKIKLPNKKFHHESEEFSFRDKKWMFTLRTSPISSKKVKKVWKLHLVNLDLDEYADKFDIETFIEDKVGNLHSFGVKNVVSVHISKTLLSEFTRSVLLSHDPPFLLDENLTIVFKFFHDIVQVHHLSDAAESDKGFNEVALQKESPQSTLYENWFTFPEIKPRGLIQPPVWTDVFSYIDSLSEDFQNLKIDNLHWDAELKCSGRVIPVHRGILSAQSKVFKDMFQETDSDSSSDATISVEMTYPLLKEFITYIYTGHLCKLSEEKALQLYEAAVKYSVERLRKRCSKYLADNLNEVNAIVLLAFADAYRDSQLKERTLSYIVEKEIHERNEAAWFALRKKNPDLAVEVLSQAYQSLKSKRSVDKAPKSGDVNSKSVPVSKPKPIQKPVCIGKRRGRNHAFKFVDKATASSMNFDVPQLRPCVKSISASVFKSINKATASSRDVDVPKKKLSTIPLPSLGRCLDEAVKMKYPSLRSSSSKKHISKSYGRKQITPDLVQKRYWHI